MIPPDTTVFTFPPITQKIALAIAAQAISRAGLFECYSKKPDDCHIYSINTDQPCWYVYPIQDNSQPVLSSSRVIVISRLNGEILYDGSAGDEG